MRRTAVLLLALYLGHGAALARGESIPAPTAATSSNSVARPETILVSLVEPDTVPVSMPMKATEPPWGIIGVAFGFFLAEGSRWVQALRRRRRLMRALRDESRALLLQVPNFIEICQQMIASLRQHRLMPGPAVGALRTVYDAAISELTPHLNNKERNLLHIVHERLKVGDAMIAKHGEELLEALRHQQIPDPWAAWITRFEEQIESYRLVQRLLQSFVTGKPVDVFPGDPESGRELLELPSSPTPVRPPTHDVAHHFLRIVGAARHALHGIYAKIGAGLPVVGPRALRPNLQSLQSAIVEFHASKTRVVELHQAALAKELSDTFADVETAYRDADRYVSPYEKPDVSPDVPAHFLRPIAQSAQSRIARLDALTKKLEQLTE